MQITTATAEMAQEIISGLTDDPKSIPSKYFYDARGSEIFAKIMRMPEYYLTDAEAEIFQVQGNAILDQFYNQSDRVELVELGAGDGSKTSILIRMMINRSIPFRYIPVDISEKANRTLMNKMNEQFSNIEIETKTGDYFDMINQLGQEYRNGKIILFLGSNLGNYPYRQSLEFLRKLASSMKNQDKLFLGLDLKKDPAVIRAAYDDPHGYTEAFNMNLLERLNRELEANFIPDNFIHAPTYDPLSGIAKSYLVSRKNHQVTFGLTGTVITFDKWETIYTEMSQKYDHYHISEIAEAAGFEIENNFFDSRSWFVNSLWKLKQME